MNLNLKKFQPAGFVLIVVLCTIMLLEVLLLGFNYKCRADLRAVDQLQRSYRALNSARAGLNIAAAAVRDIPDFKADKNLMNLFSGKESFNIGDDRCLVTVAEESGKLNVNLLKDENGTLDRKRVDQLLRLIDLLNMERHGESLIGYGLVPAIIDWTDEDDDVTYLTFIKGQNVGAESGYYGNLVQPYRCRNKPLETIDEMLLIKDVTVEVFDRIHDYVTVNGDGKININCAPKLVIQSLSEKMDAALAQMIIERREIKPFDNVMQLRDVPGMTDDIYQFVVNSITVSPTAQYYYVQSKGIVDKTEYTIEAILKRNTEAKDVEVICYKEM